MPTVTDSHAWWDAEAEFDHNFQMIGMNVAWILPITHYRILISTEARSHRTRIMPQSSHSGQAAPLIVVRTVHGDAIAVRIEQLGKNFSARFAGDTPESESSQPVREAG